ncbi:hypothetical protein M5C99_14590 [Acidovorax sp. NCPPB 2350]|nr:hypothetical protein M5C99_14590 [Acidovorax sp. NCPPB 2350]
MANHTSKAGKRQPKTLIRELNGWLKPDGLQVVDWGKGEINPPPKHKRYSLETIGDDPDWDLLPDLEAFHAEMQVKHTTQNNTVTG